MPLHAEGVAAACKITGLEITSCSWVGRQLGSESYILLRGAMGVWPGRHPGRSTGPALLRGAVPEPHPPWVGWSANREPFPHPGLTFGSKGLELRESFATNWSEFMWIMLNQWKESCHLWILTNFTPSGTLKEEIREKKWQDTIGRDRQGLGKETHEMPVIKMTPLNKSSMICKKCSRLCGIPRLLI